MTSDHQLSLLPEGRDDLWSALHRFEASSGVALDLVDRLGAEIGELSLLGVAKEVFDGIEFGRVARQALEDDLVVERFDVVANEPASMRGQTVPDDQQFRTDLRPERFEEFHQLRASDRTTEETEVEPPEGHAGNQRELVPVEAVLQRGRAAFGRPGLDAGGPLA